MLRLKYKQGEVTRRIWTLSSFMVVRAQSSAAGVLALLSEPDPAFKQHAISALHPLVPQFWAEISEHIAPMHVHSLSLSPYYSPPIQ